MPIEYTYEPMLVPRVVIPRRYHGVEHSAEIVVLAYEGDLPRLFGASARDEAPTTSRALAWQKAGKAWGGRLTGYQSDPSALVLVEHKQGERRGRCGLGVELHKGGRLSYGLLVKHVDAIDQFFGAHLNLDTKRTIEITRRAVKLTPAQARMLAEVREHGERRYNGRARKQVEALAEHGLVDYDYTFREGGRYVESYTVRPA